MNEEFKIIGATFIAFIISLISIPSIVTVARAKGLCEVPDRRRLHKGVIPTLGGVAIFAAMIIPLFLIPPSNGHSEFIPYLAASSVVLFYIGIKDDILLIAPTTKLIGQTISAAILCIFGNIRITDLHGILGITQISYPISVIITIFLIITTINAFNLIDGIDGLCGLLGITISIMFAIFFRSEEQWGICIAVGCFVGAILGFLRYNLFSKKEKIFMGDTGSQIVGLFCAFLAIEFCEQNLIAYPDNRINYAPITAFAIQIIPLFDVIRIIFIRLRLGKAIFQPDNNHIHFRLLHLNLTHLTIDFILILATIFFTFVVWKLSNFMSWYRLSIITLILAMAIFHIPQIIINKRRTRKK